MSGYVLILVGLFMGVLFFGAALLGVVFVMEIKKLSLQVSRLTTALTPILESGDVEKVVRYFRMFTEMGEEIGRKMDAINTTIRTFYQFAINKPPANMSPGVAETDSGVFSYSEEEAASRLSGKKKAVEDPDQPPMTPQDTDVTIY